MAKLESIYAYVTAQYNESLGDKSLAAWYDSACILLDTLTFAGHFDK